MMRLVRGVVGGLLVVGLGACATANDGVRERVGDARFDAKSVTTPTDSYFLLSDGTWAGSRRWRLAWRPPGSSPASAPRWPARRPATG